MFLERVEIQGFKSFANKVTFEFQKQDGARRSITAVVGPNGSGKSNLADAIRWVLGEQSMKTLRGKKSEDVIFAGSDKKARLGFAEVSIHLNNEDTRVASDPDAAEPDPMSFAEIVITRRLYRDGNGEYIINGAKARLSDIQLLLAKAHFGQKTYTVIGQGLIDQILLVTPRERKEFFDEAAGVKEFQLKRHQALLKLHATRENISQATQLVAEIEPRLKSLQRAVKRLEERDGLAERLLVLQRAYYGTVWHDVSGRVVSLNSFVSADDTKLRASKAVYDATLAELHKLEGEETQSEVIIGLQREYEKLSKDRGALREEDLRLKTAMEVSRVRREVEVQWAPLPLTKIIEELEGLFATQQQLNKKLRAANSLQAVQVILDECEEAASRTATLVKRLQRPAPEVQKEAPQDPKVLALIEENQESILLLDEKLKELSERMHKESHREQEKKSAFFGVQRRLQDEQRVMHDIEQRLTNNKVDRAKYETRAETIKEEMRLEIPDEMEAVMHAAPAEPVASVDQAQCDVYNLKHQLDLVGGIDPEVTKEFEETNTRYTFLTTQLADLSAALTNTENTIGEFDDILKTRRTEALETLNELFQDFFAQLFRGGNAKLVPVYETAGAGADADEESEADAVEEMEAREVAVYESKEPVLVGIDIQAQPPGKRIKDISILSGGERAMTSVALLCAIMASNPSPFVVLDEVDAALDEANSIRYADILEKLAERTQFIVITHNRATMGKGEVLYGVTMGDDGVSQLLSVKFEQAERWAK